MPNVISVTSFRKLDTENIAFYEDLYVVGEDKTTITFTPLGASYYGSWFRRFGFRFDGIDAHTFFTTVRDINRILWEQDPVTEQSLASLPPEEQAVWSLWLEGRFEEFSQALTALAEKRKNEGSTRVIPLFNSGSNNL